MRHTSVNNVMPMAEVDSFKYLLYTSRSITFGIILAGNNVFEQLTTSDQIEYHIMTKSKGYRKDLKAIAYS